MTDLDLAELRRIAEAALDDWGSPVPTLGLRAFHEATYPPAVLALLDRIESLEADRDEWRERSQAWDAADRSAQENLMSERDRAEARLARVTDDSMAERIAKEVPDIVTRSGGYLGISDAALLIIRAVAADEQSRPSSPRNPATGFYTVHTRKTARNGGAGFAADEQEASDA